MNRENLVENCTAFDAATQQGKEWMVNHIASEEYKAQLLEINKYLRKLQRLKKSCQERPTIAVFGASQAGKSYLISNLVKSKSTPELMIRAANGKQVSFIKDMNPFGSRESTGTVTRFTTKKRKLDGFRVRLFSTKDLICIITNGYYQDIKEHEAANLTETKFNKTFIRLEKAKRKEKVNIVSYEDVLDIKEYLLDRLRLGTNLALERLKNNGFWERAASLAPFLEIAELVELFSFLWGNNNFFDLLFDLLLRGLQNVDYNTLVSVDLDALTPNDKTILDIMRVKDLFEGQGEPVKIKSLDEKESYSLDRNILATLTAEVELPLLSGTMKDPSMKYLEHSDVLDFPGARSREHISEKVFESNDQASKLQVFIRGKVAYLFDLYNRDFGISTLLYCMDHKPPEVQRIPALLYSWLSATIGATPSERKQRLGKLDEIVKQFNFDISTNPLLVVLTKFDAELQGKPSEKLGDPSSHHAKWEARIQTNFIDFIHRPLRDKWITSWSEAKNATFRNIFPLRDPNFSGGVFLSEGNMNETKVNPSMVDKLADMQQSFVSHKIIADHSHAPKEVWNEIAKPNKTGLDYIIKYLTPCCRPEIKLSLIKAEIAKTEGEIHAVFKPFYNPESIDELLKIAKKNGAKAFMHFTFHVKDQFGHFLERILITEDEAWAVYQQIQNSSLLDEESQDVQKEIGDFPVPFIEMLASFGIAQDQNPESIIAELMEYLDLEREDLDETITEVTGKGIDEIFGVFVQEEAKHPKDLAMYFTDRVLGIWLDKLNTVKSDNKDNALSLVIQELIKTKNRVDLRRLLYDELKEEINNFSVNPKFQIVAKLTTQIVNNFVNTFGWHFVAEEKRPLLQKENRRIFTIEKIDYSAIQPSIDIKFPLTSMMKDWVEGARSAFTSNVHFEKGIENPQSIVSNQDLGKILTQLDKIKNEI